MPVELVRGDDSGGGGKFGGVRKRICILWNWTDFVRILSISKFVKLLR